MLGDLPAVAQFLSNGARTVPGLWSVLTGTFGVDTGSRFRRNFSSHTAVFFFALRLLFSNEKHPPFPENSSCILVVL